MHPSLAFVEGIGGPELLLIMFIILLLFGANRLPELARGIGKSVREFKKAASGVEEEVRRALEEPEAPIPKKFPAYPAPTGAIQQGAVENPVTPPAVPGTTTDLPPTPPPPAAG